MRNLKSLFLSISLIFPILTFACDEDYGQGQRYSTGYYLKNGKLTKSKVENCSKGMQEQSHTFANGVVVSFININLAMTTGGNGYQTDVYINGKEAKETQRLKGIPANFKGQCYQSKSKETKQVYCI
ncbi:hypothetical protein V5G99_06580 [Bibersteinia trehalosi]|uniref:Lipoprotein n=1 Tax=Bibersteinia trehalosi USDA-ARS-USMARC-189 TaxID=1263831 RepID=A0ABM5PCX3_BIBTR|nr:hypothetical protein [Bibersteinia trehalosi]AGH38946.1 hypothetical protein WQG_16690 [Bibersteinia trehalosi USDA-ARS-USMARC-192]AHG83520.1 hypothetical protein F543_6560 [Bibersteinia trehalosi USDA-ARS-USMARC-189]